MSRLDRAFILLIIVPAIIFAAGGLFTTVRSRAALGPLIDRHVAELAWEFLRLERSRLQQRLAGSRDWLPETMTELRIERFSFYEGPAYIGTLPVDSAAVPLDVAGARGAALLAAARQGATVLDFVRIDERPVWLAYVPLVDRLAVAVLTPDPYLAERLGDATGYQLAFYYDGGLVPPISEDWPEELPGTLADALASRDGPLTVRLAGRRVAAVPIKDFDEWETVGTAIARTSDRAPRLPTPPLLPMLALVITAGLCIVAVWRHALGRAPEPRGPARAFAGALLPPALAAAWLVIADAEVSRRATDTLLELSAGVASALELPAELTADRLARLTRSRVAILRTRGIEVSDPALTEGLVTRLRSPDGRLHSGDRRLAYREVQLDRQTRAVLLRSPLEDSRKATLFWVAGLYGLLAVSALVFASLLSASRTSLGLREAITAWAFITPSLALLLVFSAAPLAFAFYLSFHNWNLVEPAKPFVGFQHYLELAGDRLFWISVKNTAVYSLYVPATMVCALGVAMLLNRRIKGVALLRAVFFLPYVTSFVAISIVWQWMYDPDFGLINWGLGLIGLGPYTWLNDPATALLALIIMAVWIHIGFQMVIFLAGLQAIPNELYEAAMIDGAGRWRRFRKITLPLLRPTTFFVLVTSIIGSFQVFTFVYVMTEGGPLHATNVIVYHIYQNAWQFLRMGYASAMSWVLFVVIFLVTLLQFRTLGRRMSPSA